MSGYDGGGSWFEITDFINDLSKNLRQKTNTLSTISNYTFKKEFMPSFCKDFSMKLKHHSIQNTIVRSSLSSDCENNWNLPHLDIKSLKNEFMNDYDLDLSLH